MWNALSDQLRVITDRLDQMDSRSATVASGNPQNVNVGAATVATGANPVGGGGLPPTHQNLAPTGPVQTTGVNTTTQPNLPNVPNVGSTLSYPSWMSTAPQGYVGQGGVFHNIPPPMVPPPLVLTSTTTPTGGNATLAPVGAHAVTTAGNGTLAEWVLAPEQEQPFLERHRTAIRGVPYFSGATGLAVQQFFGAIENLKNADPHFPGKLFVMIARERMNGSALEYATRNAVLARTTDYALFKKTVCDRYGSGLEVTAKHDLDKAKREAGESLAGFAERLERLGSVVWPVPYNVGTAERSKLETERDGKLMEIFRLGLTTEAMTYLGARNPGTLNEMLGLAIRFEADVQVSLARKKEEGGTTKEEDTKEAFLTSVMDEMQGVHRTLQTVKSKLKLDDARVSTVETKETERKIQGNCWYCAKAGHRKRDCRTLKKDRELGQVKEGGRKSGQNSNGSGRKKEGRNDKYHYDRRNKDGSPRREKPSGQQEQARGGGGRGGRSSQPRSGKRAASEHSGRTEQRGSSRPKN